MDNMLYIVAGLVIVLLIAVLIMRRQKAQPPARSTVNSADTSAKRLLANDGAAVLDSPNGATKFDSLTIAERFMDQQRYDKAIETLERGLIQKPHDNSLSLKLLNIYAITNQTDHFYSTYEAIRTYGDPVTISQAEKLKALLDQEQNETTQILARTESDNIDGFAANAEGYDALDFDVTTLAGEAQNRPQNNVHAAIQQTATGVDLSSTDLAQSSTAALERSTFIDEQDFSAEALINDTFFINEQADNNFDLTLDDLENDTLESEADDFNIFAADDLDDKDINHDTVEHSLNAPSLDNISFDRNDSLTLDDQQNNQLSVTNNTSITFKPNDSFREIENISEDFSLNFDEQASASSSSTVDASKLAFEQTNSQASSKADSNFEDDFEDDFVLDFDDLAADSRFETAADNNALASNDTEIAPSSSSFGFELTLEDDEQSRAVELNADSALLFDDNTLIDDNFVLVDDANLADDLIAENSATSPTMPVTTAEQKYPLDFAAQFAADFDFVNDLDNNQVTLDLAAKYLELGEYDSAKRLLSEVLIQGNSEQQIQAQELLQRTA